jgi:hypothetical protein
VLLFCLAGSIVGLLLGASRFRRLAAFLLWVVYSLALLPLITLWNLYPKISWVDRLPTLAHQVSVSAVQLFTGQVVEDPTLYVVFAYAVYWFISLAAGYSLTRYGKFGAAVVPAGLALIIIQLFDMHESDRVYGLAVYVFLALRHQPGYVRDRAGAPVRRRGAVLLAGAHV